MDLRPRFDKAPLTLGKIAAKNFEAATVKLDEAEAVKFNPDDEKVISLMRRAIHTMQAQQSRQSQP